MFMALNETLDRLIVWPFSSYNNYATKRICSAKSSISKSTDKQGADRFPIVPAVAFGINTVLPMHTDQDAFLSVVSLHCESDLNKKGKYPHDLEVCKYFCFEWNVSVGLRSRDVLIFNPTVGHCVSSLTEKYRSEEVICVSHYFKSTFVSMNNNNIHCTYDG